MKHYNSIEDIDRHLRILRLQADIHKQRAEIDFKYIKHGLKPKNLIAEFFAMLGERQFYKMILSFLFKKFKY